MDSSGSRSDAPISHPAASGADDDRLRGLVSEIISASTNLDIRMWLDGIYTEIDASQHLTSWMRGREVYFKIEGKVDDSMPDDRSEH